LNKNTEFVSDVNSYRAQFINRPMIIFQQRNDYGYEDQLWCKSSEYVASILLKFNHLHTKPSSQNCDSPLSK